LIGNDPGFFYETCLVGWGAAKITDFDPEMIDDHRTAWRNPEMIHGSCSDYRAAASIDLEHDEQDLDTKIGCPTLAFFGADGEMARLFDIPAEWRKRCLIIMVASLPGGHFFVDQFPAETASILSSFLKRQADRLMGGAACLLRLSCRALEAPSNLEPHREHVCRRAPSRHPSEGLPLETRFLNGGGEAVASIVDEASRRDQPSR
jgi:hypothetical protein